jgi:hypothetical protein
MSFTVLYNRFYNYYTDLSNEERKSFYNIGTLNIFSQNTNLAQSDYDYLNSPQSISSNETKFELIKNYVFEFYPPIQ